MFHVLASFKLSSFYHSSISKIRLFQIIALLSLCLNAPSSGFPERAANLTGRILRKGHVRAEGSQMRKSLANLQIIEPSKKDIPRRKC